MRSKSCTSAIVAVFLASVLLSSKAMAEFFDVVVEQFVDPLATESGLHVVNLYAVTDDPADELISVNAVDIITSTGLYWQHPVGGHHAPLEFLIEFFPLLPFDSFITIGVWVDDGTDQTAHDPGFYENVFNEKGILVGGWFNAMIGNGQGDPDEDGRVLIAQLTLDNPEVGASIAGSIDLFWLDENGDVLFLQNNPILHEVVLNCEFDLDGDGTIGASDLAQLLGSWGPYEPCPPFDGADFNDDCVVSAFDLAHLLGNWGPCPQ